MLIRIFRRVFGRINTKLDTRSGGIQITGNIDCDTAVSQTVDIRVHPGIRIQIAADVQCCLTFVVLILVPVLLLDNNACTFLRVQVARNIDADFSVVIADCYTVSRDAGFCRGKIFCAVIIFIVFIFRYGINIHIA